MNEDKCKKSMSDAPYHWCCKRECGEHEFCKGCTASAVSGMMSLKANFKCALMHINTH